MLYYPMDFGEWTIDNLIDMGVLSGATSEDDYEKIKQIERQKVLKESPPPSF